MAHSPHTLRPDVLVDAGVHSDVLRAHLLAREVTDGLDGAGSSLLEAAEKLQLVP